MQTLAIPCLYISLIHRSTPLGCSAYSKSDIASPALAFYPSNNVPEDGFALDLQARLPAEPSTRGHMLARSSALLYQYTYQALRSEPQAQHVC
eukprot:IDg7463t1